MTSIVRSSGGSDLAGRNSRTAFPAVQVGDWLRQHAQGINSHTPGESAWLGGACFLPAGTYDAVSFHVSTAGSTGAVVKIVAYTDSSGAPADLLFDSATAAATSTGRQTITGLSLVIPAGGQLFWAGSVTQGAATTRPVLARVASTALPTAWPTGSLDLTFNSSPAWTLAGITGAAPSTATAPGRSDGHTVVAFRRSA